MGRGGPSQVCCSFLLVGEADPPPRRLAVRAERGRRQQRHAAPPVARCACASGPGSREPPALAGAGSLRAVCGSARSPQTPSSAPDGRRAPLARAAATFRRLQKISSLPACGIICGGRYQVGAQRRRLSRPLGPRRGGNLRVPGARNSPLPRCLQASVRVERIPRGP